MSTRRSSSPIPKPPFGFSTTPITWKSVPSIITSLPFGKKHRRLVFAEHHDLFFVQVIALCDEAAFDGRRVGIHLAEIGLHAAKVNRRHFAGLGARSMRLHPARLNERGHAPDGPAAVLDGVGVF